MMPLRLISVALLIISIGGILLSARAESVPAGPPSARVTAHGTSLTSVTMPTDAVFQQALQKYREGNYDETLLLLSSLPDALRQNPYVAYYQALSYDRKEMLNKARTAYALVMTLASDNLPVYGYAEKRLKTLNALLDSPPETTPSVVAIEKAQSENLARLKAETKKSKKDHKNDTKIARQEALSPQALLPQAAMAVASPASAATVSATPLTPPAPQASQVPQTPQLNPQLLQTMLLMQAMGGNGGGNGMQGGNGGGINPLLLMSLMGGGLPGMTTPNPQQPADPNAPVQGPQGINPALMQSMLMDQMMQQMDFSSGKSDQDR